MPVMVLMEVKAKRESLEQLKQTLRAILPSTRAYDGCIEVTPYSDLDDGQTLVAVEQWESRKHYEAYFAWREETGAMARLAAMLEEAPYLRFFETVDA